TPAKASAATAPRRAPRIAADASPHLLGKPRADLVGKPSSTRRPPSWSDRAPRERLAPMRDADAIDEPFTRQRVVFRERGEDRVTGEVFVRPGGFVPVHVHGCQVERFEGVSGTLRFRLGGRRGLLGAGDVLTVPPGTAHGFRNVGDDVAHVLIELTPPL